MLFLYRFGLYLYQALMHLAALWHPKARLWVDGRKGLFKKIQENSSQLTGSAWFHFASLGEFEQGRPVMEALKKAKPETKLLITFFSPSGYEIRKNYALAEAVYYLPLDTPTNAAEFIQMIQPKMAVFTKYEYWFFFFRELSRKQIPLYIVSGIFRKNQVFFKWYGGFYRRILGFVSHFFVQNTESLQLLGKLGIKQVSLSGDTRFDRVAQNAQNPKDLAEIKAFCGDSKVFIAGSTWPEDESLLPELMRKYPDWKFIIAPHEVGTAPIEGLCRLLAPGSWIKYSSLKVESSKLKVEGREVGSWESGVGSQKNKPVSNQNELQTTNSVSLTEVSENSILHTQYSILVIDNIGLLSSLYAYADVAYIGGGFGKGIHNTLEAAAFGLPVIFGSNYHKFQEAKDLISAAAGFSIKNQEELSATMAMLQNDASRTKAGQLAADYVQSRVGATDLILKHILSS